MKRLRVSAVTISLGVVLGWATASQAVDLITFADPDAQTIVSGEDASGNKANLVNGVGLGSGYPTFPDTHVVDNTAGWLSDITGGTGWLHFDLGDTYTLDAMRLWNYNGGSDFWNDRGVRNMHLYGSNSDMAFGNNSHDSWALIESLIDVPKAPTNGTDAYGTAYGLTNWDMRYVKFDVTGNWDPVEHGSVGLSEVQFLGTPYLGDTPMLPEPTDPPPPWGLEPIDFVPLDTPGDGPAFGTFQSHNQKVVANDNGTFVSYLHTSPDATPNTWRLAHSTDGGLTFSTIYEAQGFTRAPALETDEDNNIFLAHPSWDTDQMKFLRFTAANNYSVPDLDMAFDGVVSASKYAMAYDPSREQFYIASTYSQVLTVDKSGNLLGNQQVFMPNADGASGQYPHLFVDGNGVLHHVQTTENENDLYETIRYVQSPDGGVTWQTMDGTALSTPTTPGASGPSDMINLVDEVDLSTWLGTMHVKDDKVHFAYLAIDPSGQEENRSHYVRYDLTTATREIDTWSETGDEWRGENLSMQLPSALMVSDLSKPSGPLYAVSGSTDGRLSAFVTYDNGSTWQDYATTRLPFADLYAAGGYREITDDGRIIGTFTAKIDAADPWRTYYFQFAVPDTPGDANGDGKVDGLDYLAWAFSFGDDPADDPPGSPENGDFNDDGVVDGLDYLVWAINFGQGPNDATAVPEPGACALLITGVAMLLPRRRRQRA